jgi:hypothetical protein
MKSFLQIALLTAVLALLGCTKQAPRPPVEADPVPRTDLPPPTPASTIERLTAKLDPEVQPHRLEPNTAFPEAIPTLEQGAKAPIVDAAPPDSEPPPTWGITIDPDTGSAVMRDWTGLVLVPIVTLPSRAHSIAVSFTHIEAHPLKDGRIRVWTRIQNESDDDQTIAVGCSFKTAEVPEPGDTIFYPLLVQRSAYRDVFFISPASKNISAYTLLARKHRQL